MARPGMGVSRASVPLTGTPVPGYEELEKVVLEFMEKIGARAATVAVAMDGRLVYSRGFGWRDKDGREPTRPDDLMRIASISKPITSALIKSLIRAKSAEAKLETPLLACLPFPPEALRAVPDQRLHRVTLDHVLEHKAGWDSAASGDAMFKFEQIAKAMRLSAPPTSRDIAWYMLGQPLQFNPGERYSYSNLGYCFLGRAIEHLTRLPFGLALERHLLEPRGIKDIKLARSLEAHRDPREVSYYNVQEHEAKVSFEVLDSCGGMIASAPALLEFFRHYLVSGEPRHSLRGYLYIAFGSLPGTTAMVIQRVDGVDVVVLLNSRRRDWFDADDTELETRVTSALNTIAANRSTFDKVRRWLG